jgi:hypothetical protein
MTARILTIHRATLEIEGRLYRFIAKSRSRAADNSPRGVVLAGTELAPGPGEVK